MRNNRELTTLPCYTPNNEKDQCLVHLVAISLIDAKLQTGGQSLIDANRWSKSSKPVTDPSVSITMKAMSLDFCNCSLVHSCLGLGEKDT